MKEIYEIYKDKQLFAEWVEGEELNRKDFEAEFDACVSHWRSLGSKAKFEMRIRKFA